MSDFNPILPAGMDGNFENRSRSSQRVCDSVLQSGNQGEFTLVEVFDLIQHCVSVAPHS